MGGSEEGCRLLDDEEGPRPLSSGPASLAATAAAEASGTCSGRRGGEELASIPSTSWCELSSCWPPSLHPARQRDEWEGDEQQDGAEGGTQVLAAAAAAARCCSPGSPLRLLQAQAAHAAAHQRVVARREGLQERAPRLGGSGLLLCRLPHRVQALLLALGTLTEVLEA